MKRFSRTAQGDILELWFNPANSVLVTDTFSVQAGCDKSKATCISKFGNIDNFRGFPYMPGNDALTAYPIVGEGADGQSLFN